MPIALHTTARPRPLALAAGALLVVGVSAAGLVSAAPAQAHDELVDQSLVLDSGSGSVEAVQLTFSDVVLDVGTEIAVTSEDGTAVVDGDPEHDGRDVRQPVSDDLEPGDYDVVWRVVSSDGHPIEGAFTFELGDEPVEHPEVTPYEPAGAEEGHEHGDEAEHDHGEDAAEHQHDDASDDASNEDASSGVLVPILIGVGAVVVVALIAVPLVLRSRRRRDEHGSSRDAHGPAEADGNADTDGRDAGGDGAGRA